MNHDIELYNFYRRYVWNETDFTVWQAGMVNHSRGMFEGLLKGSVLEGFEISPSGSGLAITVSEGLASGPSGYFNYLNDSSVVSFDAANSTYRRDLVVVRPNLINNSYITRPTNAFESVPLKTEQASSIVVIKGVEANSPEYPDKLENDVVICGVRVKAGVTPLSVVDVDLEVRDVPGKNSNFQENFGKYDDRLRPYRSSANILAIKPSQLHSPFPKAFSFVNKTNPSIFPKSAGGLYNGASGDTFLNMQSGAITGADQISADFTPTVPAANTAIVATVGLLSNDTLTVLYGTQGTRLQCLNGIVNQATAGAGSVGISQSMKIIAFVIVFSADGANVTELDFVDCRGMAAVGASGSGVAGGGAEPVVSFPKVLTSNDSGKVILLTGYSASDEVELPPPDAGLIITLKDIDGDLESLSQALKITRDDPGTEIEGLAADYVLFKNYGEWTLTADGTKWWFI